MRFEVINSIVFFILISESLCEKESKILSWIQKIRKGNELVYDKSLEKGAGEIAEKCNVAKLKDTEIIVPGTLNNDSLVDSLVWIYEEIYRKDSLIPHSKTRHKMKWIGCAVNKKCEKSLSNIQNEYSKFLKSIQSDVEAEMWTSNNYQLLFCALSESSTIYNLTPTIFTIFFAIFVIP